MRHITVTCFGEVLWDLLPSGKVAGGAPMNVAYQLNNLGVTTHMISRVGSDNLGTELLEFLNKKGVSTHLVQTDPIHPTGVVQVSLNENGSPEYDIVQPSAWDFIEQGQEMLDTVRRSDALVFGSLACRAAQSQATLFELIEVAPLRVFDVNLRAPFYNQTLLEKLMTKARIVKMNDHELDIMAGWYGMNNDEATQMKALRDRFALDLLIVTKGEAGAVCLSEAGRFSQSGAVVRVKDTIGSGDAFLAGFLSKMLAGADIPACLRFANALGALTATKEGGTPVIGASEIQSFLASTP